MFEKIKFQGDAFVKIDPRTKLLLVILCSFAALREPRLLYQGMLFALAYFLLINGREFWYAQKMLIVYLIMIGIDMLIKGSSINSGIVILVAGILVFKMFLPVIMVFSLMIRTTKVSEFLAAFKKMHFPDEITIPFAVMFRFFPTIGEEWTNIKNAMKFRGFAFNIKNIITRPALIYECLIVPLLSNTVIIADELSAASLCRGLGADNKRTCLADVKMGLVDFAIVGFALWLNIASLFAY
ncbi:MAG: energy-coupling factor transporter transmembrane protein EcfT [Eubacterium sp.]|nr:energy-coupling factor transporter transmembrane protein EcfT [Eubacterium sp.]